MEIKENKGKFAKKLLISDYDNTLRYTEAALQNGGAPPPIHPRNLEAIRYWIAEGGIFTMATGRALAAFRPAAAGVPINAPVIVDNGASIYDLRTESYLIKAFLPEKCLEHLALVSSEFPGVSLELYHTDDLVQVINPTLWNEQHAKLTNLGFQPVERIDPNLVELPLVKALFVSNLDELRQICGYMERKGWTGEYELIFSSDHLLEMTAKGANKGQMALRLKDLCRCEKLYCAGDHANDLPMLLSADRGFAPSNAIPEVLSSGVTEVCHCTDGALAEIVEIIEKQG